MKKNISETFQGVGYISCSLQSTRDIAAMHKVTSWKTKQAGPQAAFIFRMVSPPRPFPSSPSLPFPPFTGCGGSTVSSPSGSGQSPADK